MAHISPYKHNWRGILVGHYTQSVPDGVASEANRPQWIQLCRCPRFTLERNGAVVLEVEHAEQEYVTHIMKLVKAVAEEGF